MSELFEAISVSHRDLWVREIRLFRHLKQTPCDLMYSPAVKSYCKFSGFKLLYMRGGKDGFTRFHGYVNNKQQLLYYFPLFL